MDWKISIAKRKRPEDNNLASIIKRFKLASVLGNAGFISYGNRPAVNGTQKIPYSLIQYF